MKESNFEPIHRKSLREIVSQAIRQAIMRGDLKPGDRLREVQIAEQMGVSRAPVREAIRDLESAGLVTSRSHKGTFVTELTPSDLWEIYTLRAALERMAVEIITPRATPELLETLQRSIADMTEATQAGDVERMVELDIAFHETLCRHANHDRLFEIWNSMIAQIRVFIDMSHVLYLPPEEMVSLHVELVQQIENKDARAAGQTLAQHILEAGELIVRHYNTSQKDK